MIISTNLTSGGPLSGIVDASGKTVARSDGGYTLSNGLAAFAGGANAKSDCDAAACCAKSREL